MLEIPKNVDVTALRGPTPCNFECRYVRNVFSKNLYLLSSILYMKPGDYYEMPLCNISEVSNVGPESPFPLRVKDNFPKLFELLTVQKQWK
jgi:hypothetical protein